MSEFADKERQHYLLHNAVALADLDHIVGLDVEKAEKYLTKKYISVFAIRGLSCEVR